MVRILVDSAADYEPQELSRMNVECVPISIRFGNESYWDGIELTKEMFYEKLEQHFPTTSQPSPYAFAKHFEAAKQAGDEMVVITVSSTLSGTYQGACLARKDVGYDKVYIVDSKSATIGIQVQVDHALRLRDEGASAEEIVAAVTGLQPRIRLFACMHTLEYLCKGGRLSKTAADIGTLAHLRPLITLTPEGTVGVVAKCIGMKRSIASLVTKVDALKPDPAFPLYPIYSKNEANLTRLIQALRKKGYNPDEASGRNLGPTVGSHIGPDCCGIAFVATEA